MCLKRKAKKNTLLWTHKSDYQDISDIEEILTVPNLKKKKNATPIHRHILTQTSGKININNFMCKNK